MFWRISCLRQVQDAVALNGDAAVLFCFASNLKKRLEVDKIAKPLFREAKFHFDFDAEGKIFVHQMGQAGHEAVSLDQQLGEPASRRPFLPQWVGLFSNRSEGVQSPDEHSPGENCAAKSHRCIFGRDAHSGHHALGAVHRQHVFADTWCPVCSDTSKRVAPCTGRSSGKYRRTFESQEHFTDGLPSIPGRNQQSRGYVDHAFCVVNVARTVVA